MIRREGRVRAVLRLLRRNPVVAILGARQIGKTTLASEVARKWGREAVRFDLEDPLHLARLDTPRLALDPLRGLVILDEIQRRPELFPILRVLADRPRSPARFLVLGSASPALLRQSSESLAGRVAFYELGGLSPAEVGTTSLDRLWLRGGFPRSFLARSDRESLEWRADFVRTFLERDLPQLGIRVPAPALRRFWTMLAHYHGQIWNASEFSRAFGVSDHTVRSYLDLLTSAFAVRQLHPWHENLSKRQVKSPKLYLADTGLLHSLLDIRTRDGLLYHPKVGASWEGFALEATGNALSARPSECYFWATHAGAELDLLIVRGRERRGFEFKFTDAPVVTSSMRIALADLKLDRLDVVHAGRETFPLAPRIRAVALARLSSDL